MGVPLCTAWLSLFMRRDGSEEQIFSTTAKDTAMSATTIHSTDNTTKARFLAPGTHQRPGAKGAGKGQAKGCLLYTSPSPRD